MVKSVYSTHSTTQAHLIKGLLREHGIHAQVMGDYLQGGVGELQAIGFIEVRVNTEQEQPALALIEDFERDRLAVDEQALTKAALHTPAAQQLGAGDDDDEERRLRETLNGRILGFLVVALVLVLLAILLLER